MRLPERSAARRRTACGQLKAALALLVVAATTGLATVPAAGAQERPMVRPTQEIVSLLRAHRVVSSPRPHASKVDTVPVSRPITGARTVLPVLRRTTAANGVHWLRVLLPGRPNGHKGWITENRTVVAETAWHIVVRTSKRQVTVYRGGRRVRTYAAIVGKPSTPTPHGRFFVEESVRMLSYAPGAPFALATSARSNVFQEFEGGPGQIAIHGVANLGGTFGTASSHGCVRLSNRHVTWLAAHVPAGVLVDITR